MITSHDAAGGPCRRASLSEELLHWESQSCHVTSDLGRENTMTKQWLVTVTRDVTRDLGQRIEWLGPREYDDSTQASRQYSGSRFMTVWQYWVLSYSGFMTVLRRQYCTTVIPRHYCHTWLLSYSGFNLIIICSVGPRSVALQVLGQQPDATCWRPIIMILMMAAAVSSF